MSLAPHVSDKIRHGKTGPASFHTFFVPLREAKVRQTRSDDVEGWLVLVSFDEVWNQFSDFGKRSQATRGQKQQGDGAF
jgi:hypothetical protein